jgi:hypothetical protein
MKRNTGVWIDHRQAVVVILLDKEEEIKHVSSGVGKRTRYSGASEPGGAGDSHNDASEDGRDRRHNANLGKYYDIVISHLREADSILIMGPGEAKGELRKRIIDVEDLSEHIAGVEAADKLTDNQIVAAVRQHFEK